MSNYDPNQGPSRPGYNPTDPYEAPNDGRPGYILLAALAAVALVGGFLYFGTPQSSSALGLEQAQAPAPIERTVTDRPGVMPGADHPASIPLPASPASPAPATTPTAPQE